MPPDAFPEALHHDAAGWVLGALSSDDAAAFEEHIGSCQICQQAVAEFQPVARIMGRAVPEPQPPPELQVRTLAAVAEAARVRARPSLAFRRRRGFRLVSLAAIATAAVIAAAVISLRLSSGPAEVFTTPLHGAPGSGASGQALAHPIDGGFAIRLTVRRLPDLGPGRFYECWYAGSSNQPGAPRLITAGTFTVGRSGATTVDMTSAADPRSFSTMQITVERAGDGGQHGTVILSGKAS